MSEETNSSTSQSRPLTAAERQDLYSSAIGSINNTYRQSGFPYDGSGSMNYMARFDGNAGTSGQTQAAGGLYGNLYRTYGQANTDTTQDGNRLITGPTDDPALLYDPSAGINDLRSNLITTLHDIKSIVSADAPNIAMPTGARDPGGINFPTYVAPAYQNPGNYRTFGDYTSTAFVDPGDASQATFVDPGQARQMAGGDYARLEQNIANSITAPLDRAKQTDTVKTDADLARRGIWSSGLAVRALDDVNERYAPQYTSAGAQAATQRYGMEQTDLQNLNAYNAAKAAAETQNNQYNVGQMNAWRQAANQLLNSFNQTESASRNTWNMNNTKNMNDYNLTAAAAANAFNTDQQAKNYTAGWAPLNYLANIWGGTAGNTSGSNTFGQRAAFEIG